MSEQNTFVASDETVGRNRKPNRKAPKQISFRVSESEYLKLQQSAETLNMSVPAFVKKKAHSYLKFQLIVVTLNIRIRSHEN